MYEKLKLTVAENLQLSPNEIFGCGKPITSIIAASPIAINSIDMFEAFAGAFAEHEVDDQLNLPAFTLSDSIDDVMEEINKQLNEAGVR